MVEPVLANDRFHVGGRRGAPEVVPIARLLPPAMVQGARVLGLALRLAYKLSAGTPNLLQKASLSFEDGMLQLRAPLPPGESVERDLASLIKAIDTAG